MSLLLLFNDSGAVSANLTGLQATGAVGDVTVVAIQVADVQVTGVAATGAVGGVTVVAVSSISVSMSGLSATATMGTVTILTDRRPVKITTSGGRPMLARIFGRRAS